MPLDRRDELGPVPAEIAAMLTPCFERGPRSAVRANVAIASGVLLVVPDASRADTFTAMSAVIQAARAVKTPVLAADATTNMAALTDWAKVLPETSGSTRLLVTGPRATRWKDGEALARRIVSAIAMAS